MKTANVSSAINTLVINNVTQQEYYALSAAGQTVSSELYIIDPDSVNLDARGDWVTNVKTPELSSDAANKAYVDSQLSNAGGGFSFERYWPEYNSAAQTYVLKPGRFNILSNAISDGDNLVLEDYTKDNVYKVQLTGNASVSATVNILVDTNAGDVLPGAYTDNTIASCLTAVPPKQICNFEISYGNVTLDYDYNGDALRTVYLFPTGPQIYGEEGYESYGIMPYDNATNHLGVNRGAEQYSNKPVDVIMPIARRVNKVLRMRHFTISLEQPFGERGMQFRFPQKDQAGQDLSYVFMCGEMAARYPNQGDVLTFVEHQRGQLFVSLENADQNLRYQFVTPVPSNGIVTMKDRHVNYVHITTTS